MFLSTQTHEKFFNLILKHRKLQIKSSDSDNIAHTTINLKVSILLPYSLLSASTTERKMEQSGANCKSVACGDL